MSLGTACELSGATTFHAMSRKLRFLGSIATLALAVVFFAAEVTPQAAKANLAAWPSWLSQILTSHWASFALGVLFAVATWVLGSPFVRRRAQEGHKPNDA